MPQRPSLCHTDIGAEPARQESASPMEVRSRVMPLEVCPAKTAVVERAALDSTCAVLPSCTASNGCWTVVQSLIRRKSSSSSVSAGSLDGRADVVCDRSQIVFGPISWAGKLTSGCRKPQPSGVSWTNGYDTGCERSSSSSESAERRPIGSCERLARTGKWRRKWQQIPAAGGVTVVWS